VKLAYSLVEHVKASAVTGRRFSGIATSPQSDRVGDEIVMSGVTFAREIPLLLYHRHDMPVGMARLSAPTDKGIPFTAEIPDIADAGPTRDRCNEAATMVRNGLIRAVSIGFRTFEDFVERLTNGGLRFLKIEVLELSLVVVPANQHATITDVRAFCKGGAATSSAPRLPVVSIRPALRGGVVRLIGHTPPPKQPYAPPSDVNNDWQRELRLFYRKTGIEPKHYVHAERERLAREIHETNPAELTNEDIAFVAFRWQADALKMFNDRAEARRKRSIVGTARAGSAPYEPDDLFVTRRAHDEAIQALRTEIANLKGRQ
jgi:HK97 family phage prohead protease